MNSLVTTLLVAMGSLTGFGFNFNSINLYKFKGRIEPSSSADVMIKHRGSERRKNPQEFHVAGYFANELGTTTNLFNLTNFPVNINSSGDRWNGLPAFSIYDVINNGATVSNLEFQYMYWGTSYYEDSYKPYYLDGVGFQGTDYLALRLELVFKKPTISNVIVNQSEVRQPIVVNWSANIQDLYDFTITQNGIVKYSITGTTEKTATIPENTLSVGAYEVRITAANNPYEDMGTTNSLSTNFTGTSVSPTVDNLEINQTEPRMPIKFSWVATNQTDYRAEIVQSRVLKANLTGGAVASSEIPPNILTDGEFTINLYVKNTLNGISTTTLISKHFIAKIDKPIITSLEPDQINQNVDNQINVSWVCGKQDTYELKAYQDDMILKTYKGSTQKSLVIPAETFKVGNINLELVCLNTINGITAAATRVATFLGYGTPKKPILDPQIIYSKARPTFKWISDEQTAYIFEIWKDNIKVEGTSEILGTYKSYTVTEALSNNSNFIVKVKVKNQFNLWSDFATKEITVSYTVLPKPEFDVVRDGSGILITMLVEENKELASLEIWRKDAYSKWVRLAYDMKRTEQWTDNTVASGKEYFYKVIANDLNGGMSESDIKAERAEVKDFVFVDIEDASKKIVLRWNPKVSITNIRNRSSKLYAGCSKPKIEKGKVKYKVASMEFTVKKPELEYLQYLADTSQIILFRDRRGEKIYGQISLDISETYELMDRINISFEFTELNFIEKDIHKGSGGIVLTFHNGKWKFDGTITYSGYGVS